MITSSSNRQMKNIMQLQKKARTRYEQRVFVVEGPKMCLEAPKEWIERMYVSESFFLDIKWKERLSGYTYEVVSDSVLKSVCDTKTPQGIICLVRIPDYEPEDLFDKEEGGKKRMPHLLLAEGIQDPGNLGTIIRTGEGAGITGIILDKGAVDIFHPKVVRATMGSIFRVPFFITEDLRQTVVNLQKRGIALYAAHLKGEMPYDAPDYTRGIGFLIGNEGSGLSEELAKLADAYIRIPMEGQVESLNAAIAAALFMYEVNRQRR